MSLRQQGLLPESNFAALLDGPDAVGVGMDRRFEGTGCILDEEALVTFAAWQALPASSSAGSAPTTAGTGPWTVTGERRQFRERALVATKDVSASVIPGAPVAKPGRWSGPPGLRYAESLPATARAKLLAVANPGLADSLISRRCDIPGIYGFLVTAIAANAVECVAVIGRHYVNARASDSEDALRARLANAPWELTILRGVFREQLDAG